MQGRLSTTACFLILAACSPTPPVTGAPPTTQQTSKTSLQLTQAQKNKIGQKIWQNESGGKVSGLTAWNTGEEFPSLGIGHFIWYPQGAKGPFTESWPQFVAYARQRGIQAPPVAQQRHCPWTSRAQFQREFNSPAMKGLRNWLSSNVSIQTEFITQKSRAALPKILQASPAGDRARIQDNYYRVATTANGVYALIDYVNFKGEGINPKERYRGQGWGLLQVLSGMKPTGTGQAAAREFAASAKRCLGNRIKNSPPSRGENRWRAGWFNRCDTYARPF